LSIARFRFPIIDVCAIPRLPIPRLPIDQVLGT
jgi:hypothetical protein